MKVSGNVLVGVAVLNSDKYKFFLTVATQMTGYFIHFNLNGSWFSLFKIKPPLLFQATRQFSTMYFSL